MSKGPHSRIFYPSSYIISIIRLTEWFAAINQALGNRRMFLRRCFARTSARSSSLTRG